MITPRTAVLFERPKPKALSRAVPAGPRKPRPALSMMTETVANPLDEIASDHSAPLEEVCERTVDAAMTAFHQRQRQILNEASRQCVGDYYRVMVFSDGAQADAFAKAVGENPTDQYFDGRRVCDRLGIELPPDVWKVRRVSTPNRRLSEIVRKDDGKETPQGSGPQAASQSASQEGGGEEGGGADAQVSDEAVGEGPSRLI